MSNKTWILEPRDPVIVRDGRPFSAEPGASATTLQFPFPSTIAGATRTRAGRNPNGVFDEDKIPELLEKSIIGPLLVQLTEGGEIVDWFAPAPADALLLKIKNENDNDNNEYDETEVNVCQLKPIALGQGLSNTPVNWLPTGINNTDQNEKPHDKAPHFWCWKQFRQWLFSPQDQTMSLPDLGIGGLKQDTRTHVKITPDSQTAEDSALFQTRGIEFSFKESNEDLGSTRRLALALTTDADVCFGLDFLGGERRLSAWQEANFGLEQKDILSNTSSCPNEILNTIQSNEWYCRLFLLTPAFFNNGSEPTWLINSSKDVSIEIIAAAMSHYQVVSGWDYK